MSRLSGLLALLCALALLAPAAASAHARLEATSPDQGAVVKKEPGAVVFTFDEPVEGNFGAVRVYDASGEPGRRRRRLPPRRRRPAPRRPPQAGPARRQLHRDLPGRLRRRPHRLLRLRLLDRQVREGTDPDRRRTDRRLRQRHRHRDRLRPRPRPLLRGDLPRRRRPRLPAAVLAAVAGGAPARGTARPRTRRGRAPRARRARPSTGACARRSGSPPASAPSPRRRRSSSRAPRPPASRASRR